MNGLFAVAVVIAVLSETGFYYLYPRALRWLAVVPLGRPAIIPIGPRALEALTDLPEGESGYRERRTERVALERIQSSEIRTRKYVAWIDPARNSIVTRLAYRFFGGRGMGLSSSHLEIRGTEIVVTTRQAPLPVSIWLVAVAFLSTTAPPLVFVFPALVTLLSLGMTRGVLARARNECLADLEQSVRAFDLGDDRTPARHRKKQKKRKRKPVTSD